MKIEWLVANARAVGFPDRAERAILGVILAERFVDQFRACLGSGSHFIFMVCDVGTPS